MLAFWLDIIITQGKYKHVLYIETPTADTQ